MQTILEANKLCKQYKDFALKDVSLSLPKGAIMGFIGENGAGKTTTIRLLLHMVAADSGSARIFGLDHVKDELAIKQEIGVVFDELGFYETLKPKDIAAIHAGLYRRWDDTLFQHYLEKFRLPQKQVKEYSRGMKMKLAISAALSHHPKLLILDEATSGLDPVVRNEILDEFLEFIQDEEHSILFSSHITSDLEHVADYITLIHEGQIVFSRSKDELVDNYGILRCGAADFETLGHEDMLTYQKSAFGYAVLVDDKRKVRRAYPKLVVDDASVEDIMLFYIKGESI